MQAVDCGTGVGGIAGLFTCDRDGWSGDAAADIRFSPFRSVDGLLCPRSGFTAAKEECHLDAAPDPTGTPCALGDEQACTCFDLDEPGEDYPGMYACDALTSLWSDCQCRGRGYEAFNLGDGSAHPDEPARCDSLGARNTKDFQGVLMHEIGHGLGLGHSELTPMTCAGPASPAVDGGYQGVMSSADWPRLTGKGRQYHFDDLRGLDWLYTTAPPGDDQPFAGPPPLETSWRMEYFESADGVDWGAAIEVPWPEGFAEGTSMRVGVSSAVDGTGFQAVTYGLPGALLGVLTRDDDGFDDEPSVVPGAVTRWPAGVAYGGGRLAVAWLEQDDGTNVNLAAKWAVRSVAPGSIDWVVGELPITAVPVVRKELGLGYDAASDAFVLAVISDADWPSDVTSRPPTDGVPWIVLIDPADATILHDEGLLDVGVVHTIGKPVCHGIDPSLAGTHCALPVASAVTSGPKLGISYFGIAAPVLDIVPTVPELQLFDVVAFGAVDLASGGVGQGSEQFVGSLTTSSSNLDPLFGIYSVQALAAPMPATIPPGLTDLEAQNVSEAPGGLGEPVVPSWSVSLGSRRSGDDVVYSVWRPVPFQPDGTGDSGDDVGTDETGGDADGGDPGCQCHAMATTREVGASWLALLALFALRRSRRE